jgi:hypothetical protein
MRLLEVGHVRSVEPADHEDCTRSRFLSVRERTDAASALFRRQALHGHEVSTLFEGSLAYLFT